MVSQREKTHANKWAKELLEKHGIWSERLVDTPYISEKGVTNYKKPFDRLVCVRGVAIEFKYKTGKTFNLKKWKEDPKTRHQYMNLKKFSEGEFRVGILLVFWKKAKTRNIQKVWAASWELNGDRIVFEDMHTEKELIELFLDMRYSK